jgi:4'-phosphopantetheinyl transferase EntD
MARNGDTIAAILPPGVKAVERFGPHEGVLLKSEQQLLGRAVAGRQAEFAAGRSCARDALAMFGVPPTPILIGGHREPVWPPGFIGSITHCQLYCAAAVGRRSEFVGIGIDAELNRRLDDSILKQIASPSEWDLMKTGNRVIHTSGQLLFSAKESVFKAWFCIYEKWLGFDEVFIEWLPEKKFVPRPLSTNSAPLEKLSTSLIGRYLVQNDRVFTSVVIFR